MKKAVVCIMVIIGVVVMSGNWAMATAKPKFVAAVPSCNADGDVTIPAMPKGSKLVNIWIYNDTEGAEPKSLGAVSKFKLYPGEGFNFTWEDSKGTWFQMITPYSVAEGLATDCSSPEGCKYLFPPKN